METIQHIIIDNTLKRIGEAQFTDYLCHAYCYDGHCTFQRNGQSFRFEAGDCLIIARRGDLVTNLKQGNTEVVAQKIKALLPDADVFQIDTIYEYSKSYMTCIEEAKQELHDQATLRGRSRVNAAVFGGGRHTWRLQLSFRLVKHNGRWQFTAASASTY